MMFIRSIVILGFFSCVVLIGQNNYYSAQDKPINLNHVDTIVYSKSTLNLPIDVVRTLERAENHGFDIWIECFRSTHHSKNLHLSSQELESMYSRILDEYTYVNIRYQDQAIDKNPESSFITLNFSPNNSILKKEERWRTRPIYIFCQDQKLADLLIENLSLQSFSRFGPNGACVFKLNERKYHINTDEDQLEKLKRILEVIAMVRERKHSIELKRSLEEYKSKNKVNFNFDAAWSTVNEEYNKRNLMGVVNQNDFALRFSVSKSLFPQSTIIPTGFYIKYGLEYSEKNAHEKFDFNNYDTEIFKDEMGDTYHYRMNGKDLKTSMYWRYFTNILGCGYRSALTTIPRMEWFVGTSVLHGVNIGELHENHEGLVSTSVIYPELSNDPLFDSYFNPNNVGLNSLNTLDYSYSNFSAFELEFGMNYDLGLGIALNCGVRYRPVQTLSFVGKSEGIGLPTVLSTPSSLKNQFYMNAGIQFILGDEN